jgi:predicted ATP-grasp superfamily ATP-dependent carboligase
MSDILDLWESPQSKEMHLFIGWRQWADAGSVSSGLPRYLVEQTKARQIGKIKDDEFFLFQIPGTHDLLRPLVHYQDGFPISLEAPHNEIYYAGDEKTGFLIIIGDEPQLRIEKYIAAILEIAQHFKVRKIIGFGGVYGEVPFDKKRTISCTYSLQKLKPEVDALGVNLSDYRGGASIGSFLCKRAGESDLEYVSFYAFVPAYDFSSLSEHAGAIRIENDYTAWLGVMERVKIFLNLDLDLTDLEIKTVQLNEALEEKIQEIDQANPEMGIRTYFQNLSERFEEVDFDPSSNFWEEKLRGLFDDMADEDQE